MKKIHTFDDGGAAEKQDPFQRFSNCLNAPPGSDCRSPSQPGRNRLFAPASANTPKISERPWTCMEALRASGIIKPTAALLEFLELSGTHTGAEAPPSQGDILHPGRKGEAAADNARPKSRR